jgi:dTDP-4-dehydrorhamnose reductase
MRILIVGAGGQVGQKISRLAKMKGHIVAGGYKSEAPTEKIDQIFPLDKTIAREVGRTISEFKPEVVVDTAALHNVDYCESHPDEAMLVNREGTAIVAQEAARNSAKFIFISTDFVFDGIGAPYDEEDRPNPLSVYAKSKLEGEKAALLANQNSAVCRPAVIYSWVDSEKTKHTTSSGKPLNFGAWLVSQLLFMKEVRIVNDQVTSPTLADDLAGAILAIAESSSARGIYHTAGTTALSRYDFSLRLAKRLGLDESLIHPIDSSQLKQIAKRPPNSSLVSLKIQRDVGYTMMNLNASLDKFAEQYSLNTESPKNS